MKRIIAAAIIKDGKILIAKRNYGELQGYWEFPGGKVEGNESDEECICREIREEFNADMKVEKYLGEQAFQVGQESYLMVLYQGRLLSGHLELLVHSEIQWVKAVDLLKYKLSPVDEKLAIRCFGGNR